VPLGGGTSDNVWVLHQPKLTRESTPAQVTRAGAGGMCDHDRRVNRGGGVTGGEDGSWSRARHGGLRCWRNRCGIDCGGAWCRGGVRGSWPPTGRVADHRGRRFWRRWLPSRGRERGGSPAGKGGAGHHRSRRGCPLLHLVGRMCRKRMGRTQEGRRGEGRG
jgi:hypothetical protein